MEETGDIYIIKYQIGIWQSCTQKGTGLKTPRAVDILITKFPKCLTLVRESASTRNSYFLGRL